MPEWIALSGTGSTASAGPGASLARGLLVFDIALPLLAPTLLLDHTGPEGALMVFFQPGPGFGITLRQDGRLTRHMLAGTEAAGTGTAQLRFGWDAASGEWSLGLALTDARGREAAGPEVRGTGARALSGALLAEACALQPQTRRAPALLWFGVTAGAPPRLAPCLGPLTPIATPRGPVPAGRIRPGDQVLTCDHGILDVQKIQQTRLPGQGSFTPVHLRAPFFGAAGDLLVSGTQQIMLSGYDVEYLFGVERVLAEARHLVDGSRACFAPRTGDLPWIALDLGVDALVLSGRCALATSPVAGAGAAEAGALLRIDAVEARALQAMRPRGILRSAA
jgi:hypothetical protein